MAGRPLHVTHADTRPDPAGGGMWAVACMFTGCSWVQVGRYRFSANEPDALALAQATGTVHEHRKNRVHENERGRTA